MLISSPFRLIARELLVVWALASKRVRRLRRLRQFSTTSQTFARSDRLMDRWYALSGRARTGAIVEHVAGSSKRGRGPVALAGPHGSVPALVAPLFPATVLSVRSCKETF
ncbi:hypothetical protein K505DRAFT_322291 [Melanomma pulvis-pyrius CBS 109.77]|uniref:Uncharacterized protein n=1 Tax=Melanomma pulvis-pyrius CBS 109.77 TaxID=1314802 RepID=A0A6A6XMV5_9PLEO|nr:hypothetical protein K505DRAFT_322291 [Melanomma pulvis-pyrius CBS 109.77]